MDAKLSITNYCGAKCATCPNWKQPVRTMPYEDFEKIWEKLNAAPMVGRILINNVGDVNELPDSLRYLIRIEDHKKPVIMTTNANSLVYVPRIEELVISFNGGTKESYERTTGLSFAKVIENIRNAYKQLERIPKVEMHCIIWKGNEGTEERLLELWKDFPGRIRFGYKVENQGQEYFGKEEYKDDTRIFCDYLTMLSIAPTGKVISCAHDFSETTDWGDLNAQTVDEVLSNPERVKMIKKHSQGIFDGLCESCNYNVSVKGKFIYGK